MIPSHVDPRAAKALNVVSRLRGILDRYERGLRTPAAQRYADLDIPLRAVTVAEHYLASGLNRSIGRIPEVPVGGTEVKAPAAPEESERYVTDEGRALIERRE